MGVINLPSSEQFQELLTKVGAIADKTGTGIVGNADSVVYNNINSGLESINIQSAVDEVAAQLAEITYLVSNFKQAGDADDTASINRALAFVNALGGGKVRIPFRFSQYVISHPLLIYSNTTLDVDRFATIFLTSGSNCRMLENANKTTQASLTRVDKNIKVLGGIWNGNGDNQTKFISDGGTCTGFLFSGVENLEFRPTKILETQTYACWFCNVKKLLIEDIETYVTTPTTSHNQDGIHIQGPSDNITIRNCTIKADDNVIALNANDTAQGTYSTAGDITNVFIDRIHFNETRQGILILSGTNLIDKVRIQNITGSAKYLAMLKCWGFGGGNYGDITFENINIDWIETGSPYRENYVYIEGAIESLKFKNIKIPKGTGNGYMYAFNLDNVSSVNTLIKNLEIDGFESNTVSGEGATLAPTFVYVSQSVVVENLRLKNFKSKKSTSTTGVFPVQVILGTVNNLYLQNFDINNARKGSVYLGEAIVGTIFYENILLDSVSNNMLQIGSTSTVSKIVARNSGKIIIPPYSIANNNAITTLTTIKNTPIDTDYKNNLSALPVGDYWRKGDIIYNTSPSPSGYLGWVCATAGWRYSALWAASTAYTFGTFIKAGGALFMCIVAGTSGTTTPNTWSGDSTDGTVTWRFISTDFAVFKGFGLIEA